MYESFNSCKLNSDQQFEPVMGFKHVPRAGEGMRFAHPPSPTTLAHVSNFHFVPSEAQINNLSPDPVGQPYLKLETGLAHRI